MPTSHHPRPQPLPAAASCSVSSARLDEPLAGSGPRAAAWLAIEQPGPWGRRALTESHLDVGLGRELSRRAEAAGVRIALIRRPGRHALAPTGADVDADADAGTDADTYIDADADPEANPGANPQASAAANPAINPGADTAAHAATPTAGQPRQVLFANTIPGRTALRSMTITDPRQLLDLDFAALAAGDWTGDNLLSTATPEPEPVLFVCTNGKRDRCCALLGRALTLDLAELMAAAGTDGLDIWECDHLGGHRFAPTALVLPTGYVYGRLDAASGAAAAEAARTGRMITRLCRGRSTWSPRGQAADLALRDELQEFAEDAVLVLGEQQTGAETWAVELTAHGVRYRASVAQRAAEEPRAESCGKEFGRPIEIRVLELEKLG